MLLDRQNTVSTAQALTSGTITSTDHIDLGSTGQDRGNNVDIFGAITTPLVGGTSVQPVVQTSPDQSTWTTQYTGRAMTTAELNALGGSPFLIGNLPNNSARFVRLQYVLVGTYTAGAITAGLAEALHTNLVP